MCSVAEKPPADDLQPQPARTARVPPAMLAARRRKETLLPEITQLALEGHSSQAIADKLGMPKRTVNYWLQEARQEWIAGAALSAAEMFAADLARLNAIYREAMQAWRNSQSEIDVRLVQHTQSAEGKAMTKRSIRSQPQRGNAAFLTRATAAVMASWRLKGRPGPPGPDAIARELPIDADGGSLPADMANEDLQHMNEDQLRGYRARLSATIEAIDELADEFHALGADNDPRSAPESSQPGPESLPPATESLPPESGSLPSVPESSPPVSESSPPAPEGPLPAPESPAPEQDSGKFGQRPASLILTLLHRHIEMKESELRKIGQESTVEDLPPDTGSLPPVPESSPPEPKSGKFGQVLAASNGALGSGMAGLVTGGADDARNTGLFGNLIVNTVDGREPKPTEFPQIANPIYEPQDRRGVLQENHT